MMHGFCFLFGPLLVHLASGDIVNVALHKPASKSSNYTYKGVKSLTADDAVDGDTSLGLLKLMHTAENQPFAWWKVDLRREVQNATVRIYFRTEYKARRNGLKLYTSTRSFSSYPQGELCHTVTGRKNGADIADVYKVTCPGRWRYLLVYTDTDNDGDGPVLDFAEVEVWSECSNGTYGEDCTKTCSSRNCVTMTITCERDGGCPGGCQSGWAGVDCTQVCPCCETEPVYSSTPNYSDNGDGSGQTVDSESVDGHNKILVAPIAIVAPVAVCCTLLLVGGVCLCLVRLGRLQWVKNPESVQVSRDNIQMYGRQTVEQPDEASGHAHSSSQVPSSNYEGLVFETREEIPDYGVIEHGGNRKCDVTEQSLYENV